MLAVGFRVNQLAPANREARVVESLADGCAAFAPAVSALRNALTWTIWPHVVATSTAYGSIARSGPTRTQIALWLAIVAVALATAVSAFGSYQVGSTSDDAEYVILAHQLITLQPYRMTTGPDLAGPERYPFVYPLVLSVPLLLAPDSLEALKVPSLMATLLVTALLFWGWRRFTGNRSYWWALAAVSLFVTSRMVTDLARKVMSEPLFLALCILALLLAQRRADGNRGFGSMFGLSMALTLALFTRTIGVVLVATVLLFLFVRIGKAFWREAALILVQMATLTALLVSATSVQVADLIPVGYLNDPHASTLIRLTQSPTLQRATEGDSAAPTATVSTPASPVTRPFLDSVGKTLQFYLFRGVRYAVVGSGAGPGEEAMVTQLGLPGLSAVASLLVTALVFAGLARRLVGDPARVAVWFTLAYTAALLLWRGEDERLLYPILPVLLWGLLSGIELVASYSVSPIRSALPRRALAGSVFAIAITGLMTLSVLGSWRLEDSRWHVGDLASRTQWLRSEGSSTDVVMTERPTTDFVYGAHQTVRYPDQGAFASAQTLWGYARGLRVKYVLVAPDAAWQPIHDMTYSPAATRVLELLEVLTQQGQATLVHSEPDTRIQVFALAESA